MQLAAQQIQPGLCSVIMPCYNRAMFLPDAFEAIRGQTFRDWELLVVDDGSTDDTADVLHRLTRDIQQPVRVVRQEQAGAYAARGHGLGLAMGEYIAFYDSDDLWLSHHLQDCISALKANSEVDWVFAACRRIDAESGRVLVPTSFYEGERPRRFMKLCTLDAGPLKIFNDRDTARCAIGSGLSGGLQLSVIRRRVFETVRFRTDLRNGEDRFLPIRAVKAGLRLGYLDNVHMVYRIHRTNSSAVGIDKPLQQRLEVYESVVRGYKDLQTELTLNAAERRALRQIIAQHYFWEIGYALYWQHGRYDEALHQFRRALRCWPWSPSKWKTFLAARLKCAMSLPGRRPEVS